MFNELRNRVGLISKNYGVSIKQEGFDNFTDLSSVTLAEEELYVKAGTTPETARLLVSSAALHEGGHLRYTDNTGVTEMIRQAYREGFDMDKLNALFQTLEDLRVDRLIAEEYPGYKYEETKAIRGFIPVFVANPPTEAVDLLLRASGYLASGIDLIGEAKELMSHRGRSTTSSVWEDVNPTEVKAIADKLASHATKAEKTMDSITSAMNIYRELFPVVPPQDGGKEPDPQDGEGEEQEQEQQGDEGQDNQEDKEGKNEKKGKQKQEKSEQEQQQEAQEKQAEEDSAVEKAMQKIKDSTGASPLRLPENIEKKLEELENMLQSVESHAVQSSFDDVNKAMKVLQNAGVLLWTPQEVKEVHDKYCQGLMHQYEICVYTLPVKAPRGHNAVNRYAKRNERITLLSSYTQLFVNNVLNLQANKYAKKLAQLLINAKDSTGDYARSGKLQANKVWKPLHVGNGKPFFKLDETEIDGYVVDVVIDASGSQSRRMESIQKQAYVIAKACSLAGIPCRIVSHQWGTYAGKEYLENVEGLTILERFKDYDDKGCYGAFDLKADGSNKDGLAFRVAGYNLLKRPEKYKIMCILSDGVPAAWMSSYRNCQKELMVKKHGRKSVKNWVMDYIPGPGSPEKDPVVLDCFRAVQELRREGVHVFGMFTGRGEESIAIERATFGTDFAVLDESTPRFVEKAMEYITNQIQRAGH